MDEQIFADAIGAISVIGGAVRLDFFALSPTERDANGQPKAVFCKRVVMSIDGFMRAAGKVQEAAQAVSRAAAPGNTAPAAPSITTEAKPADVPAPVNAPKAAPKSVAKPFP